MKWLDRTWGQVLAYCAAAICAVTAIGRGDAATAPVVLACAFLVTALVLRALAIWRMHVRHLGQHYDRADDIAKHRSPSHD